MFSKVFNIYKISLPIKHLTISCAVYFNKVLVLLENFKKELPKIITFFFLSSMLDVLGIAAVLKAFSFFTTSDPTELPLGLFFGQFLKDLDTGILLIVVTIILLLLYSVKFLVALLIEYTILDFCARVSVDLRHKLFKSYMRIPFLEFYSRDGGEYLDTMHRRVAQFSQTTLFSLLRIIADSITIIAILLIIGVSFPEGTSILAFVGLVLLATYFLIVGPFAKHFGQLSNKYSANLIQFFKDGLTGKREIVLYGKENDFASEIRKLAIDFARANRNSLFLTKSSKFVIEFVLVVGLVGGFALISFFPANQSYLIPFFSVLSFAAIRVIPAGYQLSTGLLNLQYTRPSVDDLFDEFRYLKNSINTHKDSKSKTFVDFRNLELKSVSFSYCKENESVLRDINLFIKKGSIITIIGESGSGKSTLLNLILGLIRPDSGEIKVNGLSLQDVSARWQGKIAFCPQQPFIFKETLFRNISLDFNVNSKDGLTTPTNDRLKDALNRARLDRTSLGSIKNIQKVIFDGGSNISGGQRQRVGLTRSFYSDREIIVFDEPTSALDIETEKEIFAQLKELSSEKTIILSSHSEFALGISDEVYSISNGTLSKIHKILT